MKKKIMLLVMAMSMTLGGCGMIGKDSRSYIEGKVSNIDEVYPTENLEDLFEKFPEGFKIQQIRGFDEDGKSYSYEINMTEDSKTKEIKVTAKKVLIESSPHTVTTLKETNIEYKKVSGLELEDKSLTEELLPKNYFLFQKVKLNKKVLSELDVTYKRYNYNIDSYDIVYDISNNKIEGLEGFDKLSLGSDENIDKDHYSRGIDLTKNEQKEKDIYIYIENIRETKGR